MSGDPGAAGAGSGPAEFETVIGVEVHVQLRTSTKMFCGCRVEFGGEPNTRVCPVCLGLPGALPVPNDRAVELGIRAAAALECEIGRRSRWERKNYFYPDLPKGYQVTQYGRPLARSGEVVLRREGEERRIGVRRLHLEEDAGKSLHDRVPGRTAVDFNRAGVPLAEIVSEPDIRTPAEARAYLTRLKQLLEHYARVSDCNMEEGSLRVDANLSVRPAGRAEMGTKAEVKNLNSFSNVEKALAYERRRQVDRIRSGDAVSQETRHFDADREETRPLRVKEEAFDYRYFPEPDLPPLVLDPDRVRETREALPQLPHRVERELAADYGLSEYDAGVLARTPDRAAYFREAVGEEDGEFAKTAANFLLGPVAEELNRRGGDAAEEDLLPAKALSRVVELRRDGTLSSTTADRALELMLSGEEPPDPDAVVERHGLAQVRNRGQLVEWVRDALEDNPEEVRRYGRGEEKLLGYFMGRVMARAEGRADPERARELLQEELPEPGTGAAGEGG